MHWKAKSTIQMQRIIPYYLKLIQKFLHSLSSMNMWKKGHFLWVWFNLSLGEEAELGRKDGAVPDISCSFCPCFFLPWQRREVCSRECSGAGSWTPCLASTALSHLFPSVGASLTESFAACLPSVLRRVVQGEKGLPEKGEVGCLAKRKARPRRGRKERYGKREKPFPYTFPMASPCSLTLCSPLPALLLLCLHYRKKFHNFPKIISLLENQILSLVLLAFLNYLCFIRNICLNWLMLKTINCVLK